jgi:hypothetical protein
MVISTASMGELLGVSGTRITHIAPALPAVLDLVAPTVLPVQKATAVMIAVPLISAKPLLFQLMMVQMGIYTV